MSQLKYFLSYVEQLTLLFQHLEHPKQASQLHQFVESTQLRYSDHPIDIWRTLLRLFNYLLKGKDGEHINEEPASNII